MGGWLLTIKGYKRTFGSDTKFTIFFNVYLFLRERERERQSLSGGGAERERQESEAGSRLRAVSTEPDTGIKLTNCKIMT